MEKGRSAVHFMHAMFRPYSSFASLLVAGAVAVLPLFFIPSIGIALDLQKGMLVAAALGLALCTLALELSVFRHPVKLPSVAAVLVGLPLLLAALLSFFLSGAPRLSVWGSGFESGATASFLLLWFVIVGSAAISRRVTRHLLSLFIGSVFCSAAISALLVLSSSPALGGLTLAGVWTELSFLVAGALLVTLVLADATDSLTVRLWYAGTGLLLGGAFLLFLESTSLFLLLAALIGTLLLRMFAPPDTSERRPGPWAELFGIACLLLLIFFGVRSPVLNLGATGRPSLLATELVAVQAVTESMPETVFGSGPGTFSRAWERYRPVEFNTTPYWNVSVDQAYSTALTLVVTMGVFGLLAFLFIPFGVLSDVCTVLFGARPVPVSDPRYSLLLATGALSTFSFLAAVFDSTGLPLLLTGGLATGCFIALRYSEPLPYHPTSILSRSAVLVVSFLAGAGLLWVVSHQFLAASYRAQALTQTPPDSAQASALLQKASALWPLASYQRDASRVLFRSALSAAAGGAEASTTQAQIQEALRLANRSVQLDPGDLSAWASRASLYLALVGTSQEDAAQSARESLRAAQALAPNRPDILFIRAILDQKTGDISAARADVAQALILKPDFQDVLNFQKTLQ